MDKVDRIFRLHSILRNRRTPVSRTDLLERLECSEATLYRTIATMRDQLHAPIMFDDTREGYCYVQSAGQPTYELPGLWFSAQELQSLLVLQEMLSRLEPGLLSEQLAPIAKRIGELMTHKQLGLQSLASRIRLLGMATRGPGIHFGALAEATLQRRRVRVTYRDRTQDVVTERTLSPQRLVHYRNAWYLDAWCHLRKALRSFAVDRVQTATQLPDEARVIAEALMEEHFTTSYGIFGGKPNREAVLRFTPDRARWVADERWHPEQLGQFLTDGQYELRIPYRDHRELLMDVMKYGAGVEVVGPPELRSAVAAEHGHAAAIYLARGA